MNNTPTPDTEHQRSAFEAAYIDHGGLRLEDYDLDYDAATNRYRDDCEQSAWWAWQAAIELDRQGRGAPVAAQSSESSTLSSNPCLLSSEAAAPSDDMPSLDERAAYSAEHIRQLIQRDRRLQARKRGAPIAAQEPVGTLENHLGKVVWHRFPQRWPVDLYTAPRSPTSAQLAEEWRAKASQLDAIEKHPNPEVKAAVAGVLRDCAKEVELAIAQPAAIDADFVADLARSRAKYPGNARMFDGLLGEVDELRRAYAGDGDIRAEAFDVAVCAYRIATEGDAGGNTLLAQPAASAEPDVVLRVVHIEHEVQDPEVVRTSRRFDNLPAGTEVRLYTAPVAAQPPESAGPVGGDDFRACAIGDSNYAAGMLVGWNLCIADDEASFSGIREDRLRAAAQASRAAASALAKAAQPAVLVQEVGDGTLLKQFLAAATKDGITHLTLEQPAASAEPVPFVLGNVYSTLSGDMVRFVKAHNEGTPYETMEDESGVNRYTRRDFGRVTGSPHDYSDPRNTPPLFAAPVTAQPSVSAELYLALTEAMGYDAGRDGLEYSPEQWAQRLHQHYQSAQPAASPQDGLERIPTVWDNGFTNGRVYQVQQDAYKVDAARYRFLESNFESNWNAKTGEYAWFYNNRGELSGVALGWPELGACIDAARAQQGGQS